MIMWIIVLCLAILDSIYIKKHINLVQSDEKSVYNWFRLFFINYIPLALFQSYHNEISLFLNFSGLVWLDNWNFKDFWKSLCMELFNFLQYSRILYWYSIWLSGFIILLIAAYDKIFLTKSMKFCFFGMLNQFFILLCNISAEKSEYFIFFVITLGIFILTLMKIKYYDIWMAKYVFLVFINTIITIKHFFCYECALFDLIYYLITCIFSIIITFYIITYFGFSYEFTHKLLEEIWREYQQRRKTCLHFEKSDWKIIKIYGLLFIWIYFMYISNKLIAILWQDIWILREMLFIIGSDAMSQILIYPKNDTMIISYSEKNLSWTSVYFQVLVIREIISLIF